MSRFKTDEDYFAYAKTLSVIPTEDLLTLLNHFKIKIPTYIHRFVLRETIYPKVFQPKLYQSYTDELKYRLRGFNDYSIYLLEKLIGDYNLDFDAAAYKEIFFNLLFLNRDLYGLKNSFFDDLEKLKYKYAVDFEKINYHDFITQFQTSIYEPKGYLDGVSLKILKEVLVHSCTLGDLKGLGEKYGVKVPRRINKGKLIEILAARFRLTKEEAKLLDDKSVLELEIYAKEKGFNISIDLKKSDMVEYIIYDLNLYHQEVQKDNHNYQIPAVMDMDSIKIDAIQFQADDQKIPTIEEEGDVTPEPEKIVAVEEEIEVLTPAKQPPKQEAPQETVKPETKPAPEVVPTEVAGPEPEPEPVVEENEPEPEPEPLPEPEPVKEKEKPAPQKLPEKVQIIEEPKPEEMAFTSEEKELLDEKINLIIKKYHKRRRRRRFWTIFLIVLLALIIGFVGYCYVYYNFIDQGNLPFNLPVFWNN